jgi:predicted nucleic acid-binding protein
VILALDTDVLVSWAMDGAPKHRVVRRFLEREVRAGGHQVGLVPQVLMEFLHVCTDSKRFEHPLAMDEAGRLARELWDSRETVRVPQGPTVVHRTLELISELKLGRKRILDTALAATLEAGGVRRLVTLNAADYRVFSFIEVVTPA